MNYNAQYFIDKFTAIPEDMWCRGNYELPDGRCCAGGHCGDRSNIPVPPEAEALYSLFWNIQTNVTCVNDGLDKDYQQPTPRARILAALEDIKAKGF